MHVRSFVSPLVFTLVLVTAGCRGEAPAPKELKAENSGQTVTLSRGQEVMLTLDVQPSSGYEWRAISKAKNVLDSVTTTSFVTSSVAGDTVASGGTFTWIYRAARKGTDTLKYAFEPTDSAKVQGQNKSFEAVVTVE